MENIIEKLQKEVGLTEDQAVKTLAVLKDYMDKEDLHIDWEKFFKGKYGNLKDSVTSFFNKVSDKAEDFGDKIGNKVEDMTKDVKSKIKNVSKDKE